MNIAIIMIAIIPSPYIKENPVIISIKKVFPQSQVI